MDRARSIEASAEERQAAARSAGAIRDVLADPRLAGEPVTMFLDYARPRRGECLRTWPALPGLTLHVYRRAYTHELLPGWEYSVAEMKTEMIEDLERLAGTGERPTSASR